jgi:paraquat-inducible protein B
MSKKINTTLIGAFVVGAAILIAVSVALFGGSEIFTNRQKYVAYFTEDTQGLRIGSNVLLNGVRVGYVTDIALLMDRVTFDTRTRVTMQILLDNFIVTQNGKILDTDERGEVSHDRIVHDAGMRAQLETQSFVTGQLVVKLVLRPDTPAIMRDESPPYPEIPTVPSELKALMTKLQEWVADFGENVDFKELTERIIAALEGVEGLVNSPDIRETFTGLNQIINDEDTQQLSTSFQATLGKMQATLEELQGAASAASELISETGNQVESLGTDLDSTLAALEGVLTSSEQTLIEVRDQLSGDSVQMYQLESTLDQVESAARAIREFFDYVERNPEALLRGKNE